MCARLAAGRAEVCGGDTAAEQRSENTRSVDLPRKTQEGLAVVRARKHHTAFLETTLAHRARRASYPLAERPVPPLGSTSTPGDRARRCQTREPSTGPLGYARLARLIRVVWVPPRDSRCLLPLPPLRPSRVARRRSTRIRNDGRMTDTPSARSPGAPQARSTRSPASPSPRSPRLRSTTAVAYAWASRAGIARRRKVTSRVHHIEARDATHRSRGDGDDGLERW